MVTNPAYSRVSVYKDFISYGTINTTLNSEGKNPDGGELQIYKYGNEIAHIKFFTGDKTVTFSELYSEVLKELQKVRLNSAVLEAFKKYLKVAIDENKYIDIPNEALPDYTITRYEQ